MEDSYLIKIAENISKLTKQKRIYNANIITELHANENAHSRILRMFLQYDDGSLKYPILKKFIEIPKIRNVISNNLKIIRPQFTNEQERIDVLIEEAPTYAIIIENKIYGATDQDAQLERYISCVKNHGINASNIYALYLTKDGEKIINNSSLTENAQKYLDYTEESNGRFIPLSYKDDILKWLEDIVLPNCTIKEDLLISALKQYIDYLKNMLGIDDKKGENMEIMKTVKEELGIKNIADCFDITDKLNNLTEKINNLRDEMACEMGNKYIKEPFEEYLKYKNESYSLECEFSYNFISISVFSSEWNKFYFKVNYENPMIYGLVNKDESDRYIITNRIPFENKKFKESFWWPAWKRFDQSNLRYPQNVEFWHEVEIGHFSSYLYERFEEILTLLDECN